jgi:hypothetical protein
MAEEEPDVDGPGTDEFGATEVLPGKTRKPFYKDPLSILGWGVAVAAIVAYWYYFVRVHVPEAGELVARITAVEGRVRVKPNEVEVWNDAKLSEPLHVGDVVQTEPRSGAAISFNAGSIVRVRPDSIVYLGGSAELSTAAWRVQSGRVNFTVGEQVTQIVTPTVRTTAEQNSTGNIEVGEGGETGVKVYSGQAEIETTQGQVITLGENEAVQVDAQGQAGDKQTLPPAPKLLVPKLKATLPFASPPEASAELAWEAVVNGDTYHVALDYNVVQAELLLSATLDEPGLRDTRHELQGLDPGRYFWRVAAANEAGLEGAFSRVSFFSVEPLAEPEPDVVEPEPDLLPRLTVAEVEDVGAGVLHVHGRAEPGSTVTVDGYEIAVQADGSFSEYVKRTGQAEVMVQATGPDGQSTEQARPVPSRQ